MDFKEGEIICINKPYGVSSFGALALIRTQLSRTLGVRKIKIGHAGTLDPLATGVLVLCTGKATKRIGDLQLTDKEYVTTLRFGATTLSYDMEYPEHEWFPANHINEASLRTILPQFTGEIQQVPPVFSACSVGGKKAYKLARKGKEVALQPKTVRIKEIELLSFDDTAKTARLRILCGKGTYIRALARDIGAALKSGAYITQLCRTRVGKYKLDNCLSIDSFQSWLDNQELKPYE